MDALLEQLKRNKGNVNGQLKQLICAQNATFGDIKPVLDAIEAEAGSKRVLEKPPHLVKYIILLNALTSKRSHCEHLNTVHWENLVHILLSAYEHLRDENCSIESVKHLSELFHALSSLVEQDHIAKRTLFAHIILVCEDFLNLFRARETSCHQYIMKIIRVLTSLHIFEAASLGISLLQEIRKPRNAAFVLELFSFACLVPQPLNTLLDINSALVVIEPREIEFTSSPELGTYCFKPSLQADLSKFIILRALALADSSDTGSDVIPSSKRLKVSTSSPDQHNSHQFPNLDKLLDSLKIRAFQPMPDCDMEFLVHWLHSSDKFSDLDSNGNARFWALVLLGQHIHSECRDLQLAAWDAAAAYLQVAHLTSAACFCISRCIKSLSRPQNFNYVTLEKLNGLLLLLMKSPTHPLLHSGSVALMDSILEITVLDDKFNKLRAQSLDIWLGSKIVSSKTQLLPSLFGLDWNTNIYYQQDLADFLEYAVAFHKERAEISDMHVNVNVSSIRKSCIDLFDDSKKCNSFNSSVGSTPKKRYETRIKSSITVYGTEKPQILLDYIWNVALLAKHSSQDQIKLPETKFEAFSADDIRGLHWFALMSCANAWDNRFNEAVLNLAEWEILAGDDPQVTSALLILKSQIPSIIGAALLGVRPCCKAIEVTSIDGSSLRQLQPLFQNYMFQRSPHFLVNVAQLVSLTKFSDSDEASQLSRFLYSISENQTEYSRLRVTLCQNLTFKTDRCVELMKLTDDYLCLQIARTRKIMCEDLVSAKKLLNSFDTERIRLFACIQLVNTNSISLADLFCALEDSIQNIMVPIAQICGTTPQEILGYVSLPVSLRSYDHISNNTDGSELLRKMGLSRNYTVVNKLLIESFTSRNVNRDLRYSIGVIENIFKRCVYSINPQEKLDIIVKSYDYMKACCEIIPQNLLCCWVENVCAFTVSDHVSSESQQFLDQRLTKILENCVAGYRDGLTLCRISSALLYARLYTCSSMVLDKSPSSPLLNAFKRLRNLEMKIIFKTAYTVSELETTGSKFELWHMVLHFAVMGIQSSGESIESICELVKAYPPTFMHQIIHWSTKMRISDNERWAALIGRLIVAHEENNSTCCISRKFHDFRKSLMEIYMELPYARKWSLNSYFARDSELNGIIIPAEVLDVSLWDIEASCRSRLLNRDISNHSEKDHEFYKYANRLMSTTLHELRLPSMGNHIVEEVPELIQNVLPSLIVSHEKQVNASQGDQSNPVDAILCLAPQSNSLRIKCLLLDIAYFCFENRCASNYDLKSLIKVSEVVLKNDPENENAKYVGILATELLWNGNPVKSLDSDTESSLRLFYSTLNDNEYRTANMQSLTIKNGIKSITEEIGMSNIWQKMNIGIERNEVYNRISDSCLQKTLEDSGLWKFANHIKSTDSKLFDFEKAWWLQEWETIDPGLFEENLALFDNVKYYPLILFFLKVRNENETFAALSKFNDNKKMLRCFSGIVSNTSTTACDSLDTKSMSIIRQGRELKFTALQPNPIGLAIEFENSCKDLRQKEDLSSFVRTGMKLEKLAFEYQNQHPGIRHLSLMQSAQIHWNLGNETLAISTLKFLLEIQSNTSSSSLGSVSQEFDTPDDSEVISPILNTSGYDERNLNINPGIIYSKLGTWSRRARNESDRDIMQNYFEKAESFTNSTERVGEVYHSYAKFCDESLNESDLHESIENARKACGRTEKQLKYIKQLFASSSSADVAQSRYSQTKKLLESQVQNLNELLQQRSVLTTRSIQNYLLSVLTCDDYTSDMGRFVALWLENYDTDSVNTLIRIYLSDSGSSSNTSSRDKGERIQPIAVPVIKFLPWMNQLTSRLDDGGNRSFQEILQGIIFKACIDHPHHTIWQLTNIVKTKLSSAQSARMHSRQSAAKLILRKVQKQKSGLVEGLMTFGGRIAELGNLKLGSNEHQFEDLGTKISKWWLETLPRLNLPVPTSTIKPLESCDYSHIPFITLVSHEIKIAGGLSRPKIVRMVDSSGVSHYMLLKGSKRDDLRQDAIMEQVFHLTNEVLKTSRHTRSLNIRTYNVVPYGATSGAIEFVRHTNSLKDIVEPLHQRFGGENEYSMRKARQLISQRSTSTKAKRLEVYREVEEHTPPEMRHYWPQQFSDPRRWFEAKTNWSSSCAVMSIVGYILGLGDRHCSNLLVDNRSGEVVHIDLGIAFDQGRILSVPETVPFRLTRDMVDGMGINGTRGVFSSSAEHTLAVMRQQRDRIITVLEVLKHDTLYSWLLPRVKLRNMQQRDDAEEEEEESPEAESGQADHALNGVRAKLSGSLSCEAEVRDLVAQAVDPQNLAMLFQGWSAFY